MLIDILNPREGMRVHIQEGDWTGYAGNIDEVGPDGRIAVWLTGIGKLVIVWASQCKREA